MKRLATTTVLALLLATGSPVLAQDQDGLPGLSASSKGLVDVENFGTLSFDLDYKAADPRIATQSFWLRRSDDGDKNHKVLEQWSNRHGRWKDSVGTEAFFPSESIHDQFDTAAVPFTKDFFGELNREIGAGALARSATLASNAGERVEFVLAWNPKGHLARELNKKADLKGHLSRDESGHLAFSPADDLGRKVKPLVDLLIAQLEATNKAQDEIGAATVLFGKVSAKDGRITLSSTTQACSIEGQQVATASTSYAVSKESEASLRDLLTKLDGKYAAVRAVLPEPDKDHATATAKVIGVFSGLDWNESILNAPGGRSFAAGGTLMNLAQDEAAEVSSGSAGEGRVVAEITRIDPRSDYAAIRAPNRKGVLEPGVGYVKKSGVTVLVAAGATGSVYANVPLAKVEAGEIPSTPGLVRSLPGQKQP